MNVYNCDLILKLRLIGNTNYNFLIETDEGDGLEFLETIQNKNTPAEYKHYVEWIKQLDEIKFYLQEKANELLGEE
jgi:hypothetical protein